MEITFDAGGVVTSASINGFAPAGSVVVPDDAALLMEPGKFSYIGGVLARRKYLLLSAPASFAVGSSASVTIEARNGDGSLDTAAVDLVDISVVRLAESIMPVPHSGSPVSLVGGTTTVQITAAAPSLVTVLARSNNFYAGSVFLTAL